MTAHYPQIKHKGIGVEFQVMHSTAPSYPPDIRPISPSVIRTFPSHFPVTLSGTHPLQLYLLSPRLLLLFTGTLPPFYHH